MDATEKIDWIRMIGGGFCHRTAPFAIHPLDKKKANEYLKLAKNHGITLEDAISHAETYLESAKGHKVDIQAELRRVRKFFTGKLPSHEDF